MSGQCVAWGDGERDERAVHCMSRWWRCSLTRWKAEPLMPAGPMVWRHLACAAPVSCPRACRAAHTRMWSDTRHLLSISDRLTDGQTDRQACAAPVSSPRACRAADTHVVRHQTCPDSTRQTDRQTARQTDRQACAAPVSSPRACRAADTHVVRHQTCPDSTRQTDRRPDRQTDKPAQPLSAVPMPVGLQTHMCSGNRHLLTLQDGQTDGRTGRHASAAHVRSPLYL